MSLTISSTMICPSRYTLLDVHPLSFLRVELFGDGHSRNAFRLRSHGERFLLVCKLALVDDRGALK
jgi:hypothetical protein